ncbi:uncharacterized protein PGTG_00447 [Puccinia graminis f. sp. tritici CRL 75-36-700-3]|uniref:Uncharacterized protein n=1 Tax=Puccinia graminis f. sp. tritici (strain CRL 75-36-700-3 / race SCCL) TaxID=418459 RepID=E3JQL5_PUCGT|nr:uncharacterized protein PGTG_00447 [Puccinia graminis f. sp. tritici CRL 75-36-700-3]EFP74491.1 hypothetical protein PGTG_00447 [Puccinia graminis f. sp. tritici CRL 75-36-700-3]
MANSFSQQTRFAHDSSQMLQTNQTQNGQRTKAQTLPEESPHLSDWVPSTKSQLQGGYITLPEYRAISIRVLHSEPKRVESFLEQFRATKVIEDAKNDGQIFKSSDIIRDHINWSMKNDKHHLSDYVELLAHNPEYHNEMEKFRSFVLEGGGFNYQDFTGSSWDYNSVKEIFQQWKILKSPNWKDSPETKGKLMELHMGKDTRSQGPTGMKIITHSGLVQETDTSLLRWIPSTKSELDNGYMKLREYSAIIRRLLEIPRGKMTEFVDHFKHALVGSILGGESSIDEFVKIYELKEDFTQFLLEGGGNDVVDFSGASWDYRDVQKTYEDWKKFCRSNWREPQDTDKKFMSWKQFEQHSARLFGLDDKLIQDMKNSEYLPPLIVEKMNSGMSLKGIAKELEQEFLDIRKSSSDIPVPTATSEKVSLKPTGMKTPPVSNKEQEISPPRKLSFISRWVKKITQATKTVWQKLMSIFKGTSK